MFKRRRKKTPLLIQMESTECGAACLAIILRYYGKNVSLTDVRTACDVTRDGSKTINIIRAARNYGLDAEGYSYELADFDESSFPCIVFWEFNHYLIVEGISGKTVYLNDPATGPRTITLEQFKKGFTGIVIQLSPTDRFIKGGKPLPNPMIVLWQWFTLDKPAIVYLCLLTLILGLVSTLPALLMKIFVDNVLIKQQYEWSFFLIFQIASIALVCGGLIWLQRHYLNKYLLKIKTIVLSSFVWKLLHLPFSFFQQRMPGDVASRTNTYELVSDAVANKLIPSMVTAVTMLFFLLTMMFLNIKMASFVVGLALINFTVILLVKKKLDQNANYFAQKQGKLTALETATIENMEALKANALEDYYFQYWSGVQAEAITASQSMMFLASLLELSPMCFLIINQLFLLGYGGFLVLTNQMSIGDIVAFQYLLAGFYGPLSQVFQSISAILQMKGYFSRILDVVSYEDKKLPTKNHPQDLICEYPEAILSIEHIEYGYSKLKPPLPMLTNFSLQIYPGQKIGLVGSSGSGKSTLLKLICSFYTPWCGQIYLNGQPISSINPKERTRSLAYVSQQIYLFEGTVRENLTLWNDSFQDEELYAVLETLDLNKVIHDRGGLDARVDAGGNNFSGGQKQRLDLARTLLLRPELLILDEATSALDNITEKKVYEAAMKHAKSLLIVAHRLSAVRNCDHILVVKDGILVESGTHENLMKQHGFYAKELAQTASKDLMSGAIK